MEGGGRDRKVEGPFGQRDVLEVRGEHFRPRVGHQVAPGDRRQVLAELDAQDAVAPAGEGQRGLARAAADLEHAPSGRNA